VFPIVPPLRNREGVSFGSLIQEQSSPSGNKEGSLSAHLQGTKRAPSQLTFTNRGLL